MLTQINGFFDIVEKMRAVDTTGVEPLAHPVAAVAGRGPAPARRRGERAEPARGQPAQRTGRRARPVPGAEGDRMSGDLHDLTRGANWRAALRDTRGLGRRSGAAFPGPRRSGTRRWAPTWRSTKTSRWRRPARPTRASPPASRRRCWACRSRTRTSSSPGTSPPPPARRCWRATARPSTPRWCAKLAEAGAVTLGKLNCDEFAMGSSNENSAFKPVLQPVGPLAHPGRLLRRQRRGRGRAAGAGGHRHRHRRLDPPAGFVLRHHRHQADLRPRLALRHGRLRLQPGPGRARWRARAEDCALLLSAICGPDPDRDSTSLDVPAEDFSRSLDGSLEGLRIGVPQEFFGEGLARRRARRDRRRAEANTRSWARSWWRSRCRAPSCRSPCTTSSRRPKPRPTSRASTA